MGRCGTAQISRDLWPLHFLLGLAGLASSAGSIWSGASPLMEKSRAARSVSVPPHFKPRDISSSFSTSRPRDWSWSTDDTEDRSSRDRPCCCCCCCCCWGDEHQFNVHVSCPRNIPIASDLQPTLYFHERVKSPDIRPQVSNQLQLSSWATHTAGCRAANGLAS